MKRKISFSGRGVIPGEVVRDALEVFPNLENSFIQRKTFDEYYFTSTDVELTLKNIDDLNEIGFSVQISFEEIIIAY